MRKKAYLARDEDGGYNLHRIEPCYKSQYGTWVGGFIIGDLCPELVKRWFGLKKHLRKKTCIRGTFSVSFTPDPPKSSRAGKKGK